MLKALELIGFKSFADKTRFEFPAGITVVVGPNGSGKSNIVDAIKWVLGEQSAKSLRGKDMADVIFKGAGGSSRRPMNTAEATIIFDNSEGRLAVDAPEVHVTRRVYRSGEGEYLINRQPCRLKDIRDMFRGTGVGTDAYSLIEQGKVDRMLQASPRDRRAMFEEAAGISRFKAKKVEAQRRLERVEQNMLRLRDIVDEVESRYRSVQSQASKAQRYRQHSERLQQLRTQVGLADWRALSEKLAAVEQSLAELQEETRAASAACESREARLLEIETETINCTESLRGVESRATQVRENIATRQSAVEHQRERLREREEQAQRHREQIAALASRAGDLGQRLRETTDSLAAAEREQAAQARQLEDGESALEEITSQVESLRRQQAQRRTEHVEAMRRMSALGNQVSALESQLAAAESSVARSAGRLAESSQTLERRRNELALLQRREKDLADEREQRLAAVQAAEQELDDKRRQLESRDQQAAALESRLHRASERLAVLREFERRREGVGAGASELLAKAREANEGPLREVRGLVADFVETSVETAPLIEIALGEAAELVVLEGGRLLELLRDGELQPVSRVGFLRLDQLPAAEVEAADLTGRPGVLGRADRLLETAAEFRPLLRHLLGRTWLVERLDQAAAFRQEQPQARFVTLAGELLDERGVLAVGPLETTSGLISRRSESAALEDEIERLESRLSEHRRETTQVSDELQSQKDTIDHLSEAAAGAGAALADFQVKTRSAGERLEQLHQEQNVLEGERRAAIAQRDSAAREVAELRDKLAALEREVEQLEATDNDDARRLDQLDQQRNEHTRTVTAARVELAKSEQRVEELHRQWVRLEEEQRERNRAVAEARANLSRARQQRREGLLSILRHTSALAELYLLKDSLAAESDSLAQQRAAVIAERQAIGEEAQNLRKQLRRAEEEQHKHELSARELTHERTVLADRLRDDYGVELAELDGEPTAEELEQREQVEREIAELRRKIGGIGAVNMDALEELDELEERYNSLSGQYNDLEQAKESLERIINKINADSRRLFSETLEAIRANFQVLYRKAFGGGSADLVLEEGVDILEAGVDITATPPGKPAFNNSLLSGGEKALTAVSLLLAIFQFRPSPFCVLDEVDAPFDEANIGRFVEVLRDFLDWTKFVVVTHSKKTMTAATTLYGITMQESGVSKQVSVRFEDVTEDGHIRQQAIDRQEAAEADERGAA